jgi:hypothetical protein
MASIQEANGAPVAPVVKETPTRRSSRFIRVGEMLAKILEWDKAGDELFFEHEKGVFLALSDSDIAKLSHDNKVRYGMSRQLNQNHDPENDAFHQRFKVVGANERRKEFERTVKTTSQSARATKKLQAFVGEGYEPIWSRTDKIEDRLEKGYEVVKPADDIYAGVGATDGHFETRVRQGETELVLMRVSKERKAELARVKADKAKRLDVTGETSGANELRGMGAKLVREEQGGNWQDRA